MANQKISWQALEYEEKERHIDWFWALGVIVVAGAIASIVFGNYFFALLLIISGLLLGFFAVKKPEMVSYELNEKGLQIKSRIYPFGEIKAFWVKKEAPASLFIKSKRLIMPIISIPIEPDQTENIHQIMLEKNIPEEEMKEHVSEKIMESLGF
jgi:hypothetical protein